MRVFGHVLSELRRSELQRLGLLLGLLGLLLVPAGTALGYGYTDVNTPPSSEDNHLEILTIIYGGNWSYDLLDPDGVDLVNDAGITAKRVYDFNSGDEIIHVLNGDESNVDQIWTDGIVTVTAQVKYAMYDQSFGWNKGEGGGLATNYYELLTDADLGQPGIEIDITGNFLWGIQPNGDEWWSKISLNWDNKDHMVTYFVEGVPGLEDETVWLLFWEDYRCLGDEDFNDFVVQVQAVPEPGTAFLLGAVLAGLAVVRRRRRGA